jgi:hypothetical protein
MLLSFYDTYWNDRFVDEHYDWQAGTYIGSADVLSETFSAKDEASAWKNYINAKNLLPDEETWPYYREYAIDNTGNFLEPFLISFN